MVLIVGLPGAGKTTFARRLEVERAALRFTPDEWMEALLGVSEDNGRRWVLESELFWGLAARALTLGVSVILDYGCWSETERDLFGSGPTKSVRARRSSYWICRWMRCGSGCTRVMRRCRPGRSRSAGRSWWSTPLSFRYRVPRSWRDGITTSL